MSHRIRTATLILLGVALFAPRGVWAARAELAGEAAARAVAVSAPTLDAPASVSTATDQPLSIQAVASDADAGDVLTITAMGYPAGLSLAGVPSVTPATATLSGTLGLADAGSYSIEWSVSDGTGGTAAAATALTVVENQPPVLNAPATASGAETVPLSFSVTVSDPDGDTVTSLNASGLPSGATFTPNALKTIGLFEWTPPLGSAGAHTVGFTASSGSPVRTSSVSTTVTVGPKDNPPVITSPSTVNAVATYPTSFVVSVSDPDGNPITKLEIEGTQNTALPAGAIVTINASNTSATFSWTPTAAQVGNYGIDEIAASGFLQVVKVTRVVVRDDRAPVVTAPASIVGAENVAVSFAVSASDPDGHPIASLTAAPLPLGASFTANAANTSGTFQWTPGFSQAGSYPVTFTASNALAGSATATLSISDQNRAPVANAGGPYSGIVGLPVSFDGSASSDPDGNVLTYAWDYGDGATGTGAMPSHAYLAGGAYTVSLTVTDNGTPALSTTASATATIAASFDARVYTTNANRSIRLNSGKPRWCAQVEPIGGDFSIADVNVATIVLKYGASQIAVEAGKGASTGDLDGNGVDELTVCFSKAALRTLFAGLPIGQNHVTLTVEASLMSGARVVGAIEVDVFGSGASLAATVTPNPLNPEAVLSFATRSVGALRVLLYDVNGRLVRVLLDETTASAGYHDVRVDGHGAHGEPLASGTYFFRIVSADGVSAGRLTILK
ncbi:MAG TPA: putative Ig domain-containing protein [Candidatus Eisenbacteria bacterium]|nr:putative Ig domain-containing protein [Candidatus Eisenbacteria bacterium]